MVITRSENRKLSDGRIGVAATYRPVGPTCPSECSLLGAGCYAQKANVGLHQKRSGQRHDSLNDVLVTDTKLIRHHVSGDFFKSNRLDVTYLESVIRFHWINPDIQGWTYTHRWKDLHTAGYRPKKMPPNLAILASCDTLKDMRAAKRAGWRTARVADHEERKPGEAICRYNLDHTPCSSCKLCWTDDTRVTGILFKRK